MKAAIILIALALLGCESLEVKPKRQFNLYNYSIGKTPIHPIRTEHLKWVNKIRAEAGSDPLEMGMETIECAQYHAINMSEWNFYSHLDPWNRWPIDRMCDIFPDWDRDYQVSENIGCDNYSLKTIAKKAAYAFKESEGHYKNMINPKWKWFGFGIAQSYVHPENYYFVEVFSE